VEHDAIDQEEASRVDRAMDQWRQGDCYVGDSDFVALWPVDGDGDKGDVVAGGVPAQVESTPVAGLVVVSQACDIARKCSERPLVEVSPLVEVTEQQMEQVLSGRQVRLTAIPALTVQRLVADLDRTMTVHKAIVAGWERTPGMRSDAEAQAFARALARKRSRLAFPDDFTRFVAPLRDRICEKHERRSPEGEALRSLAEIRVLATPSWDAPQVSTTFFLIRHEGSPLVFDGKRWDQWVDLWLQRMAPLGAFAAPEGLATDYATLSAADYLASSALDLEHLSLARPR
jgi:hypothetical protein